MRLLLKQEIIDNMQDIVENCMGEEVAACVATCPMHTNVKEYVCLIRDGKGDEAIRVICDKLFLPGTLGRICAQPCEKQCKWNENHSPMAIASLKQYAANHFDCPENWDISVAGDNGKRVTVIGAGPSGLQAALDLRQAGCEVTVYEKKCRCGAGCSVCVSRSTACRAMCSSMRSGTLTGWAFACA